MAPYTTRRRLLGGIAAIAIAPVILVPSNAWAWSHNAADMLDAAIDDLPDIPWTAAERFNYKLGGGFENDEAVIAHRRIHGRS